MASVTRIPLDWLRERGVRGLLVDADDTIIAGDDAPSDEVTGWIADLHAAGIKVALLSNGTHGRIERLGKMLGIPYLSLVGKPLRIAFRRGLRAIGTEAPQTAMVGDQLFTDVLGANCAGLTSVLVRPLTPGRHPHTRAIRVLERWVLGGDRDRTLDR